MSPSGFNTASFFFSNYVGETLHTLRVPELKYDPTVLVVCALFGAKHLNDLDSECLRDMHESSKKSQNYAQESFS